MTIGRKDVDALHFTFDFPLEILNPESCFIQRNYVWIPIEDRLGSNMWLCLRVGKFKGTINHKTIVAFRQQKNSKMNYLRVYLSSLEIFKVIYLHDKISNLLNKIVFWC